VGADYRRPESDQAWCGVSERHQSSVSHPLVGYWNSDPCSGTNRAPVTEIDAEVSAYCQPVAQRELADLAIVLALLLRRHLQLAGLVDLEA